MDNAVICASTKPRVAASVGAIGLPIFVTLLFRRFKSDDTPPAERLPDRVALPAESTVKFPPPEDRVPPIAAPPPMEALPLVVKTPASVRLATGARGSAPTLNVPPA